jgi:hypothetical protein
MVAALVAMFATAGFVFAQEGEGTLSASKGNVSVSGAVKMGVRMDGTTQKFEGNEGGDIKNVPVIYGYSDDIDDDETAMRGDLNATYTNGNVGLKVGVRQDFTMGDVKQVKLLNAYGWFTMFNIITPYGGVIDDNIWGTSALGDTNSDTSYDAVNGFRIELKPAEGLSFGVAWNLLPLNNQAGVVGKDIYVNNTGMSIGAFFANTIIGGLYKNDAFGAALTVKLNGDSYNDRIIWRGLNILFGVKVTAVENLLVVVDGELKDLFIPEGDAKAGFMTDTTGVITVKAVYTIGQLHFGARGKFDYTVAIYDDSKYGVTKDGVNDLDTQIRLLANYDITEVINAGLELDMNIDGMTKVQDDNKDSKKDSVIKDFVIRPKLKFNLSEGLVVNVWDAITIVTEKWHGNTYQNKDSDGPYGYVDNRFQIDLVWSF